LRQHGAVKENKKGKINIDRNPIIPINHNANEKYFLSLCWSEDQTSLIVLIILLSIIFNSPSILKKVNFNAQVCWSG